jgi:predicted nuclease of predicted toxin-antitoxin system
MAAPSVVQIRAGNTSPAAIGARLVAALHRMAPELAQGALVTVNVARNRVRVLPLRPGD